MIDIHDESGKINRSLWFVIVMLVILLTFGIDGASIVFTHFQVESEVIDAASSAATAARPGLAYQAARATISDPDMIFAEDDYSFDPKTGEITITISKVAGSMFFKHIDALRGLTVVSVTKTTTFGS